jgi:AraC-like DNA-binding protein
VISLTTNNPEAGQDLWPMVGMPFPAETDFNSGDLEEVRAHMSDAFCPHDLAMNGRPEYIAFRHTETTLRTLSFNSTRYGGAGGRVRVEIPPFEDFYLLQFSLVGAAEIQHRGCTVSLVPNQMLMLSLHEGAVVQFDSSYVHFTMKVPARFLVDLLSKDLGREACAPVFTEQPIPLTGAAGSFARLISTTCLDIETGHDGFRHEQVIDATEQMLGRLLLTSLPHSHSAAIAAPPSMVKPYYVRRVEDYLRVHSDEAVTIADLLDVAGVSARSLHAGFRRYTNDTPFSYLKKLRLDRAHESLSQADEDLSVTEVAFDVGFTHLSKFARDYRQRFGETPSETLRRVRIR